MNREDLIQCDKILEKLYWHNNRSIIYALNMRSLATECEIEFKESLAYFNYIEAKGWMQKVKRLSGNNYTVKITSLGIALHAESNIVDEHDKKYSLPQSVTGAQYTAYHAPVTQINQGDKGEVRVSQDITNNPEVKAENWFVKHLTEIIIGLIIAGLATYFKLS